MHTLFVNLPAVAAASYPIYIGIDIKVIQTWLPRGAFSQLIIVTDEQVKMIYGLLLLKALEAAGYTVNLLAFPPGESSKNNATKTQIEQEMQLLGCDKASLMLALGGGVVGDLAGFIAATYLRGIPYVQIPTTLLAMVDSSVGGKTGINTVYSKNAIGLIYQPSAVAIDLHFLKTLSKKQRINGLIEAIKMFLTHQEESFYRTVEQLPQIVQGNLQALENLIQSALEIKTAVVRRDEKEKGERVLLNFGHTVGHALEKLSQYQLLHGYAVGYGILVEATLSYLQGLLAKADFLKIKNLLEALGICGIDLKKYSIEQLIALTKGDKKACFGQANYVLLSGIGRAYSSQGDYLHPLPEAALHAAFNYLTEC